MTVNLLPSGISQPLTGAASASGNSDTFTPATGKPFWLRLSGTWAGTAKVRRSTDGVNFFDLTTGNGTVKAQYTGAVNAAVGVETCEGAQYRLEFTITSGTVNYEVRQ